ncbi:MAG: four helix bundle protein [Thermoleophilaceae bacterium]
MRYEDLKAFRLADELADDLHAAVRRWPLLDQRSIGLQLVRAADSVGANIAEAYGRWHPRDQRQRLYIARGSAYETQYWVSRATKQGLIDSSMRDRAQELGRLVNGLIRAHPGYSPSN